MNDIRDCVVHDGQRLGLQVKHGGVGHHDGIGPAHLVRILDNIQQFTLVQHEVLENADLVDVRVVRALVRRARERHVVHRHLFIVGVWRRKHGRLLCRPPLRLCAPFSRVPRLRAHVDGPGTQLVPELDAQYDHHEDPGDNHERFHEIGTPLLALDGPYGMIDCFIVAHDHRQRLKALGAFNAPR